MVSREGVQVIAWTSGCASLDSHLGRLSSLWSFRLILGHDLLNLLI
jgi:hypothetical protein